jgi:DNA-3-methyladenine glycosylase II
MFLIYELGRLDVWPAGDLGVRHGYALIWGLDHVPTAAQLVPLGDKFRPYRSIVARYCWTALEVLKPDPARE